MRLSKHHGLGNDFLVMADPEGSLELGEDLARSVCDRHLGIGADGIMRMWPAGAALGMELRNADGSSAEMSGNGIRCLVQAALRSAMAPPAPFSVLSAAGERLARPLWRSGPTDFIEIGMGPAAFVEDPPGLEKVLEGGEGPVYLGALAVSVGNPHLVLQLATAGELDSFDLASEGSRIEAALGCNVEWVADVAPGQLRMKVFERGAGVTAACGTGSVAAALAAREWGIGTDSAVVENPGGTLAVRLEGDEAYLSGPAVYVADVELDAEWLGQLAR